MWLVPANLEKRIKIGRCNLLIWADRRLANVGMGEFSIVMTQY